MSDLPATLQTAALGLTPEQAIFVRVVLEKGDVMVAAVQAKLPNPDNLAFEELIRRTLDEPVIQQAVLLAHQQKQQVATLAEQLPIRTTKESLESRYYDIMDRAKSINAFGAEIAAGKVIASMNALLKTEINVNLHRTVDEMSDKELQRIARGGEKPIIEGEFTEEKNGG
jgi:hypothetical protein